jgi:hypothetical protein
MRGNDHIVLEFKGRYLREVGVAGMTSTLLVAFAFLAGASAPAAVVECPNEIIRAEQGSTDLPECRAYEMVTPPVKGSGEPAPIVNEVFEGREAKPLSPGALPVAEGAQAAEDGERMAWNSEPLPGAAAPGRGYLSTRGAGGWTSEDVVPSMSPLNGLLCPRVLGVSAWSPDLTSSILDLPAGPIRGFFGEGAPEECGNDEPRLVPGEPEHFRNLFLHDDLNGSNRLVNVTPADVVWPEPSAEGSRNFHSPASFLAGSDDFSHVVFEEELDLTPEVPIGFPGGDELYEWSDGKVSLVSILPDGTAVHGSLAGATKNHTVGAGLGTGGALNVAQSRHAVSADGSRIFFEAEGNLYVREHADQPQSAIASGSTAVNGEQCTEPEKACTVQLDASQGGSGTGGGKWLAASEDGGTVLLTDENDLTGSATAIANEPDLYEYDFEAPQGERLKDLTIDTSEPADVQGLSGVSEDGSYAYFVAEGQLVAGKGTSGQPNLYLIHGGVTTFIATLDLAADECDWTQDAQCSGVVSPEPHVESGLTSRVSENGVFLGFNSVRDLTGYDNTDANTGKPDIEIYLYDAGAGRLSCASCKPDGSRPTTGAAIKWPSSPNAGVWNNAYLPRNVSEDGQVFFETSEALLARDGNGLRDVYQYENGQLSLLSTGTGEAGSYFLDATPDGADVFFATTQRLVGRDTDGLYDYYDARVDGGFPEPPPSPPPCAGESCRGPATAAAGGPSPGTTSLVGPGNPRPVKCPKGEKRKHGKCAKPASRPKKRHKHQKRQSRKHHSRKGHGKAGRGQGGLPDDRK